MTNIFPEHINIPVAILQPEGVLRHLPAYNKCMGGVHKTVQFRGTYGFNRKSKKHYWLQIFLQ